MIISGESGGVYHHNEPDFSPIRKPVHIFGSENFRQSTEIEEATALLPGEEVENSILSPENSQKLLNDDQKPALYESGSGSNIKSRVPHVKSKLI